MPYIWGGETDRASNDYYGPQVHGGYDCSGFVWRTFKIVRAPRGHAHRRPHGGPDGGRDPQGRAPARSTRSAPATWSSSARANFNSKATEANVDHVGIALSAHWMIHASAQGVYVSSLDEGWRQDRFTWARRVL